MNLEEVFEAQKILDKVFADAILKKEKSFFDKKIVIALLVELGEFANEVQSFKYWKKHKQTDRSKILEEYADGIHFLTSIAYPLSVPSKLNPDIKYKNFVLQLSYTYKLFSNLIYQKNKENVLKAYEAYLGLGQLINITETEIIKSYMAKNKKNYKRIQENY
ncbi:dUTP diphosphatase [Metamycoplasma auris]|uniref:Dimeric dUTPase (All-alpha-NTP-PPase superfamily) n=1 Tax=Metamycoplasma auris TaxID=51363 RepID=A0A2W7G4A7_9BACT|nr:dUTP diphosphatase [Metamycoplasma auris]PZV99900.1 dimeric dUTPase (all-alpha-NTP-PPase superfamily) [Metamycoplasma auris]